MTKEKLYVYTGENGSITTPVYFDSLPCVKKLRLTAEIGKILTNGTSKLRTIVIPASEENEWQEIDNKTEGQE